MMSVNYYNDNNNDKYDTVIGIGIVLALIAACWMMNGCVSVKTYNKLAERVDQLEANDTGLIRVQKDYHGSTLNYMKAIEDQFIKEFNKLESRVGLLEKSRSLKQK